MPPCQPAMPDPSSMAARSPANSARSIVAIVLHWTIRSTVRM